MDFKQQTQRGGTRYPLSKISETNEREETFFQPGAAGVWGKYNGQLLQCKFGYHSLAGSALLFKI